MTQQSRPTPVLQHNSNHDGPQDPSQACLFSLSSTQLEIDGNLPPRILIQNMIIIPLWPKQQMTLNKSMDSLMTLSMQYVIKFKPTQLLMSHLHTCRCFARLIIQNSLKQWRSKYPTTRLVVTGISYCEQIYLLALRQLWPSGHSNERGFPMEH